MAQLTIPDEIAAITYDVTTSQSVFPFSFAVFEKADLRVAVDGVDLPNSSWGLSGTLLEGGGYQGGTVTLSAAVSNKSVNIYRRVRARRTDIFGPVSSVPVRTMDTALNRIMAVCQDLQRRVDGVDLGSYDPGTLQALIDAAIADLGDAGGGGDFANILDYGDDVGTGGNDTAAFLAARAANNHVHLPVLPDGRTYKLKFRYSEDVFFGATIPSLTTISGGGAGTIIEPLDDGAYAALGCDSGGAAQWVEYLQFRDLTLKGAVETEGHSEQSHLLFLSGVRHVLIERVNFIGPQGDGIVLASGAGGPAFERHNFDVTVRSCFFDGVLYGAVGGRNPISVIDCDGLVIDGNEITRWGQSDMPGGIDFEPDQSFGIIKNARVTNNRFSLSGGNRGHVIIATDNIANANWQNIIIANNHFDGNSAVCIYTATTISAVPNNVLIANNTMIDCEYLVEKVNGSVWGLIFAGNMCVATTSGRGRFLASAEPSKFTLKDWTISNNVMIAVGAVTNGIADDIEGLRITDNFMRGATQAYWRLGQSGSTYTYATITGNTFMGTPSNGAIQGDGNTTATTNVWDNNGGTAKPGTFRATRGDYVGTSGNFLLAAAPPSAYPYGVSTIRIANDSIITANDSGWMITYRQSEHAGEAVWQEFIPFHSSVNAHLRYMRKAIDLSNWGTWSAGGTFIVAVAASGGAAPASVPAGDVVEMAFTVTGARSGDAVSVSPPAMPTGVMIGASHVTASNTVAVQVHNTTGADVAPTAGTWRFQITRP